MLVGNLNSFLELLKGVVSSGDQKGTVAADLDDAVAALDPFTDMTMAQFSLLIRQARTYQEYGKIGDAVIADMMAQKKPRRAVKEKTPVDLAGQLQNLRKLYESAGDKPRTQIMADLKKIESDLSAADYKELAKKFGVAPGTSKGKTTDAIYEKIGEKLRDLARQVSPDGRQG
jgi:hypothetical protein